MSDNQETKEGFENPGETEETRQSYAIMLAARQYVDDLDLSDAKKVELYCHLGNMATETLLLHIDAGKVFAGGDEEEGSAREEAIIQFIDEIFFIPAQRKATGGAPVENLMDLMRTLTKTPGE